MRDRTPKGLSLAQRFEISFAETMRLGEELVAQRLDYEKLCSPSLPRETLMVGLTKHRDCVCGVAQDVVALDKQRAEFEGRS